jgi:diguanylate cyclase (GGDEF)-like protein/PAS domain S-box-containing protein
MRTAVKAMTKWIRANRLALVVALVAIVGVVASGDLLLSLNDSKDNLRSAESDLSELSRLTVGTRQQTLASFQGVRPGPGDLSVHRELAKNSLWAARMVEREWGDRSVDGIYPLTVALQARARQALVRGAKGGRAAAAADLEELNAHTDSLAGRIGVAERKLASEITDKDDTARVLTLVISAVIGLLLGGAILVLSILHSRRRRGVEERRAAIRSERRLEALVQHGSDLITVLSPDGTVLYEAGAVESVLGFERVELEGEKLARWLHPQDRPLLATLCDVGEGESRTRELRLRHASGGFRTCEARATSLLGDDLWHGIVLNIWDVSERKQLEQRLRHQAFHDGLTSLANRVLFNERLEHALVRAVRGERCVSVLIIDLDDFKSVNDSLGHPVGDELLRDAAARLDQTMRGADTVARLGGDEFGVILDDSPTEAEAEAAAERVIAALSEPFHLAGRAISISACVGLARARPGEATPAELVRDADLAMYAAKADEKGTHALYREDMYVCAEDRLQLKSDLLEAAADGGQFELVYQPIVALADGSVAGLEALLRWNHPTRGQIAPNDFIPIAEETGAIVAIGRHVLRRACGDAVGWRRHSGRDLFVSVNVSTRQLRGERLVEYVGEALRESGLPADRLALEITETQLMRDVDQAVVVLRAVRDLGVRLAIDDFGTGYSSLSQLERLPVHALKIDREFTASREDGSEHQQLLGAVVEIGHSLGLSTVAEGIETQGQLERLRVHGYRFGQGYLFSKPVAADTVEELLAEPLLTWRTISSWS